MIDPDGYLLPGETAEPYFSKSNREGVMLTDKSLMPFGIYKGEKMEDVPAGYLDWLDGEGVTGPVKDYIDKNRDAINMEMDGDRRRQIDGCNRT